MQEGTGGGRSPFLLIQPVTRPQWLPDVSRRSNQNSGTPVLGRGD